MGIPVPPPPSFNDKLAPHQVILRPLVTEKGVHRATRHNAYSFEVAGAAGKADIRRAVEELFNVKVERVAVQNRKGKLRRTRYGYSRTKDWKKAVVTLKPDFKIALTVARIVCRNPNQLPGLTYGATHFTLASERPSWAKGHKPVAIIGAHAFYRLRWI